MDKIIIKGARENNLKVANKPDSEDICFVPDGNYKKFLENNSDLKPKIGNIVNLNGEILGKHKGLYNYTIGQRKGLGISYKVPLFVLGFNKAKNEVIVGEEKELYKKEITVTEDCKYLNIQVRMFNGQDTNNPHLALKVGDSYVKVVGTNDNYANIQIRDDGRVYTYDLSAYVGQTITVTLVQEQAEVNHCVLQFISLQGQDIHNN